MSCVLKVCKDLLSFPLLSHWWWLVEVGKSGIHVLLCHSGTRQGAGVLEKCTLG